MSECHIPSSPPEQSAQQIIAAFYSEFMPGVENLYELLQTATDIPLKISLPELQLETLIFGLHCLDRTVFAQCGPDYRAVFMDQAYSTACDAYSSLLPDHAREQFVEWFDEHCQMRQREYGTMKLVIENEGELKGVLFWEYSKRIFYDAGLENPVALKAMIKYSSDIFSLMNSISQKL